MNSQTNLIKTSMDGLQVDYGDLNVPTSIDELQVNEEERQYQEVLDFVKEKGHASCFELMKEFHISYAKAVHLMDILEERDIVDTSNEIKGPRSLLTEAGKQTKKERQQQKQDEIKYAAELEPKHMEPQLSNEGPVPQVRLRPRRKVSRK